MAEFNTPRTKQENISINNRSRARLPFSQDRIKRDILRALKLLKKPRSRGPLGVVFLNDKEIRELNRKYLNHDRPTDVLAFDYRALGSELAISLDTAERNAKIYNTSPKEEIMLYIIHGILHLYGYNDATAKARKRMFKKQSAIIKAVSG
ncbi:rRNA maturation RNase YbeY [bacterium]|nr:MAG: rRNA maturation RNase YbeY [bacterium]